MKEKQLQKFSQETVRVCSSMKSVPLTKTIMAMLITNIYRALSTWQALLPDLRLSFFNFSNGLQVFFLDFSRFPFRLQKQFWSLSQAN